MNLDRTLRRFSIFLAAIGLIDSIYLTWIKLAHQEAFCAGFGECDVVNSSAYSEIAGIPIALLGAGSYVLILAALVWEGRLGISVSTTNMFLFGITLIGVLYSAYLTYVEIAILRAICPFCVISAIVMLLLFVITLMRVFSGPVVGEFAEE